MKASLKLKLIKFRKIVLKANTAKFWKLKLATVYVKECLRIYWKEEHRFQI